MTFSLPLMWGVVCHPLRQHSVTEGTGMRRGMGTNLFACNLWISKQAELGL